MPGMRGGPPPQGPPPVRPPQLPPHLAGADPEKAALIMQVTMGRLRPFYLNLLKQVLQLTDEQIAVLPPEQRQSIMVLKEQISQNPAR